MIESLLVSEIELMLCEPKRLMMAITNITNYKPKWRMNIVIMKNGG